ncbi:acyltransferase [Elizabethkingia meningoseptica]|uniref:acyltransferase n=1 Tax=Elizabethkingia meningoseptica TaxID=238 RepID=UPI002011A414|nr:acyltransferase family protein [Elizabethkingia meningoseptica]MCL1676431.1 acyltransferase family protein [Elizabethkingia meningoseptica]MCL1687905.1 acyltransferase family protein [Elizabethkingia meningoseptica]MDE5491710.1 acyltransferase family protein [Elizabethkingia meningoseptica]
MKIQTGRTYIPWVDLLRIVACFMVLISHSCDAFVGAFDNSFSFHTGVFWGSLVRPCVPLFAMMSGILLFPVTSDLATFYKKRIGRIIIPLIFWSVALPVLFFLYLNYVKASSSVVIDLSNFTGQMTLKKIGTAVFNFNYDTTPLWYLYMLIGVYLFIPIIGIWLNSASAKDIRIFLGLWVISLIAPYIKMLGPVLGYTGNYENMGIWGVCNWNEFGTFYYFSGFIGYIILAYYLVKYPLNWSWRKTIAVAVPVFIIGFAITFSGFLITQKYFPANYANLEIVWYFCNINVAMMTFAVFIVFQKIDLKESALLKSISSATFGIFLCHFVLVQAFTDVFLDVDYLPVSVKILAIALCSFAGSYVITKLLDSNKLTSRFVR